MKSFISAFTLVAAMTDAVEYHSRPARGYNSGYGNGYRNSGYGNGYGNSGYGNGYGNSGYGNGHGNSGYGNGYGNSSYGNGYGNSGYGNGYGNSGHGNGYGNSGYGNGYGNAGYSNGYGNGSYGVARNGYGNAGYGSGYGNGYGNGHGNGYGNGAYGNGSYGSHGAHGASHGGHGGHGSHGSHGSAHAGSYHAPIGDRAYKPSHEEKSYGGWEDSYRLEIETFESTVVTDEENIWVIAFIDPACGYCKKFVTQWETIKTTETIKTRKVKFGYVDITLEGSKKITKEYAAGKEVEYTPSLYVYGHDKHDPAVYDGDFSHTSCADFILECADLQDDHDHDNAHGHGVVAHGNTGYGSIG